MMECCCVNDKSPECAGGHWPFSRLNGSRCSSTVHQYQSPSTRWYMGTHTHTPPFNGPLSGSTRVSRHQKGKINLDFTEARNSEWQWNPLGHMQVCTSLQTDNHASTPPLSFLQAEFPSCCPTNSVKALKASGGTWAQGQKICIPFVWLDDTMSCAQGLL